MSAVAPREKRLAEAVAIVALQEQLASCRVPDHAESCRRTYTGQRFHGMLLGMIRARQETPARHHRRGTAAIPLQ